VLGQQDAGQFLLSRAHRSATWENVMWSDPGDRSAASMLTFFSAASSASPAAKPSVAATAGETPITSRMLLARFPRGAIQGRVSPSTSGGLLRCHEPYRPALTQRARAKASALVEPILSKAASR